MCRWYRLGFRQRIRKQGYPVAQSDGSGVTGVTDIFAGEIYIQFRKADGTVWAKGGNADGILGTGDTIPLNYPTQISDADGNPLEGVIDISSGQEHAFMHFIDGSVLACGRNTAGQLGDGSNYLLNRPTSIDDQVVHASAGSDHTVFIKTDRTVWATGLNASGRLGDGTTTTRTDPVEVVNADGSAFDDVFLTSAGASHSLFLKKNGSAWSVGANNYGQLGISHSGTALNPERVVMPDGSQLNNLLSISAGHEHSLFLKYAGEVLATGRNNFGQLGDGTTENKNNPVSVIGPNGLSLSGVSQVAAGYDHSVFLMKDGTVRTVGRNHVGQLGDGTSIDRNISVQVLNQDGSPLTNVQAISASWHTMFLKTDGTVWTVGAGTYGRLGDGGTVNRTYPSQVVLADGSPLTGVVEIMAGYEHSLFLKSDGTLWSTGRNQEGQLGDWSFTDVVNPIQVSANVKDLRETIESFTS